MNDRSMTKSRAEALAAFLAAVRDDWQAPGIVTALGNAKQRPDGPDAYQVAIAAVRAAAEPTNRTPAVIALDGQHWRPAHPDDEPKATPTPPKLEDMRCRCGVWVVRGEMHRCDLPVDPERTHELAAAARAEIRGTVTYETEGDSDGPAELHP